MQHKRRPAGKYLWRLLSPLPFSLFPSALFPFSLFPSALFPFTDEPGNAHTCHFGAWMPEVRCQKKIQYGTDRDNLQTVGYRRPQKNCFIHINLYAHYGKMLGVIMTKV
jgi:hypothetical protein